MDGFVHHVTEFWTAASPVHTVCGLVAHGLNTRGERTCPACRAYLHLTPLVPHGLEARGIEPTGECYVKVTRPKCLPELFVPRADADVFTMDALTITNRHIDEPYLFFRPDEWLTVTVFDADGYPLYAHESEYSKSLKGAAHVAA